MQFCIDVMKLSALQSVFFRDRCVMHDNQSHHPASTAHPAHWQAGGFSIRGPVWTGIRLFVSPAAHR